MKKTYTRPVVSFESFELSTSIAAGCATKSNHAEECLFEVPGVGAVFLDKATGCEFTPEEGHVCYHVPTDQTILFTS